MAKVTLKLDKRGIAQMLKSPAVAAVVHAAAEDVAARVDAHGRPVEVRDYTTDRAASSVSIAHPAGLGMQAKYGTVTAAAAAAGLETTARAG